ncbi:mitotic spindle assembly checkpoint protein MAD1 [Venturia canescens]|uniref:mitotic spindle assembly checkpoint protein MAD1 n=1 Tax=Venturia canescens TaxID=32260 RepID=UPI001C9C92E5|nr:mitotic spindle assembly checkpoint protein MAD1 [Venturia canescens]
MMNEMDPTGVIQMINDLKSTSANFRRNSGTSVRLSGTGIPLGFLSEETECETPPKRKRLDESGGFSISKNSDGYNLSSRTGGETGPTSPWEWRRLKGEVVSLRTRLSHQEANVQQLHKIRRQMEEVFDKEKTILENQAELDKQTIKQLEARIDATRKSCQEACEAQSKVEKEMSRLRSKLEAKIVTLMNENAALLEAQRATVSVGNEETSKTPQQRDEENERIEKLQAAEARITELEEKLRCSREAQRDTELQNVELQNIRIKLENLEAERSLWEEGKLLCARAARAGDLERELNHARDTIASMREAIKGKLLLEEEMCNMRQRIQHMDKLEERVAVLETERSEVLRKLGKYEILGFGGDANVLRRELHRLQQSEAVLTAEEGQLRSKIESAQREITNITKKYEEAKKIATDITSSNERLNKLIGRLQKKMILVTRERDSYRQQLDLYEKEMTSMENTSLTNDRIPSLERALEGYRDLVTKLEAELGGTEAGVDRDECQKLREENERLKEELEHRALKGDFNCNARIMHFSMNPAAIASQLAEEKQQALIREVEELRARVQIGAGPSAAGVPSLHAQEIAELKHSHEIKIARLKEAFKVASQEYRQACYQLFGWRVDRTKEGEYKLFSQYADSPDDFLFFHVGDEGVDLLETQFSATLGALIERHLQMQHSVPMFINAVQCDLYSQQTVTNIV